MSSTTPPESAGPSAAAPVVRDGTPPPPAGSAAPDHQLPPPPRITDEARQLPPHRSKSSRIQESVEGAIGSLRDWIELRIELTKAEVRETLEEKKEQIKWGAIGAVLGLAGALILLLTVGFGLSALFRLTGMGQLAALTAGYGLWAIILFGGAAVMIRRMQNVASDGNDS